MVVFTRLLESYPYSRTRIMSEAVVDVCPLVRAEVWAAILGVKVLYVRMYIHTQKENIFMWSWRYCMLIEIYSTSTSAIRT